MRVSTYGPSNSLMFQSNSSFFSNFVAPNLKSGRASGTGPQEERMSSKNGFLAIALMSGLALAGCSNTAAGAKKDAEINADKASSAADKAADEAKPKADAAAADTKDAARDATGAVKAAVETIDVKSALMADRTVDASHINVDTFHETKTVVLKGSVKTATQRDEAARIAAAEAPGYRIDNQLTVVPNP
jgi:osmotically-inducible protein OsmY